MKISDIVKCCKTRYGYQATDCRNTIEVTRSTRQEAINHVVGVLIDQTYFFSPSYFASPDGTMWIFRYQLGNWAYDLVRAQPDGSTRTTTCVINKDRFSALDQMIDHKKQYDNDCWEKVKAG